jgi:hypothetical protein
VKKLSKQETVELAKCYYVALTDKKIPDACMFASLLNIKGDEEFMQELFTVKGFPEVFAECLPETQRKMGFVAKVLK